MKIIELSINELIPYENNPRINDNAIEPVMNSIKEFGFKNPIILDKNKVIVAGHTRYESAKRLGLEKVPCIIADDLSEEKIKQFRLVDNKTSEFAEWDFSKLEEELNELSGFEFDMSLFDFDMPFTEEVKSESESDEDYQEQQEEVPESFDEYDEELETKYQCPKCGYEWS